MAKQTTVALSVVNPHAAGIDIGSRFHWVAVDQNKENARGCYTTLDGAVKLVPYAIYLYLGVSFRIRTYDTFNTRITGENSDCS